MEKQLYPRDFVKSVIVCSLREREREKERERGNKSKRESDRGTVRQRESFIIII